MLLVSFPIFFVSFRWQQRAFPPLIGLGIIGTTHAHITCLTLQFSASSPPPFSVSMLCIVSRLRTLCTHACIKQRDNDVVGCMVSALSPRNLDSQRTGNVAIAETIAKNNRQQGTRALYNHNPWRGQRSSTTSTIDDSSIMHLGPAPKLNFAGMRLLFFLLPLWGSCRLAAALPGTFERATNVSDFARIYNASSEGGESWLGYSCASIGGKLSLYASLYVVVGVLFARRRQQLGRLQLAVVVVDSSIPGSNSAKSGRADEGVELIRSIFQFHMCNKHRTIKQYETGYQVLRKAR